MNATQNRLSIAMLAPPWIPVPPPGYGGIESVVALLCIQPGQEAYCYDVGRVAAAYEDVYRTAAAASPREPTPAS